MAEDHRCRVMFLNYEFKRFIATGFDRRVEPDTRTGQLSHSYYRSSHSAQAGLLNLAADRSNN